MSTVFRTFLTSMLFSLISTGIASFGRFRGSVGLGGALFGGVAPLAVNVTVTSGVASGLGRLRESGRTSERKFKPLLG